MYEFKVDQVAQSIIKMTFAQQPPEKAERSCKVCHWEWLPEAELALESPDLL